MILTKGLFRQNTLAVRIVAIITSCSDCNLWYGKCLTCQYGTVSVNEALYELILIFFNCDLDNVCGREYILQDWYMMWFSMRTNLQIPTLRDGWAWSCWLAIREAVYALAKKRLARKAKTSVEVRIGKLEANSCCFLHQRGNAMSTLVLLSKFRSNVQTNIRFSSSPHENPVPSYGYLLALVDLSLVLQVQWSEWQM